MKKIKALFLASLFWSLLASNIVPASAYYDWGPVGLTTGSESVTLYEGESVSVSAEVSPAFDEQLPGCGMAECPQLCGEGCANEQGDCTCAGTTYQTYYSSVSAVSADASVASAAYSGGAVTITGINAGETEITVTGSLRQYSNSSKKIKVSVSKKQEAVPAQITESAATDSVTADSVTADSMTAETNNTTPAVADNVSNQPAQTAESKPVKTKVPTPSPTPSPTPVPSISPTPAVTEINDCAVSGIIDSPMGKIRLVQITGGEVDSAEFESIMNQDIKTTFQKKDDSGNVLYSWTFDGNSITAPKALDLTIYDYSDNENDIERMLKDSYCFSFAADGELPGEATVYLRINDRFSDGQTLNLYHYNSDSGELELAGENIEVTNGYVSFSISHCSDYALSPNTASKPSNMPVFIGIAASLLLAALSIIIVIKRRKRKFSI